MSLRIVNAANVVQFDRYAELAVDLATLSQPEYNQLKNFMKARQFLVTGKPDGTGPRNRRVIDRSDVVLADATHRVVFHHDQAVGEEDGKTVIHVSIPEDVPADPLNPTNPQFNYLQAYVAQIVSAAGSDPVKAQRLLFAFGLMSRCR
jgi:hypothetical protein